MILIKIALWNMISCLINLFFEAMHDDDEFWVIYSLLIIDDFHNDLLRFMDYRFIPWWKLLSKMMHGFCMQTKHEKIDSPKKKNVWLQQITNDFGWIYFILNETIIDEYALCLKVSLAYMLYHDKYFKNKWNHVWFEVMHNDHA